MSASREKKTRQGDAQGQKHQEDQQAHRSTLLYGLVIIVVAVAAVFLLIWNSGIIQRNVTAVTIDGEKYTAADVQYYYSTVYNNVFNQFVSTTGMPPFDMTKPLKDQVYSEEDGQTWHDYIMDEALKAMTVDVALMDKADEEGHTLSEEGKAGLDQVMKDLDSTWAVQGYNSRDAFIRANYGPFMTYKALTQLLEKRAVASDYANVFLTELDAREYTDEEYAAYYEENADKLDSFTITQFIFQARVDNVDEEGASVEMTEEESKAAMEEKKAEAKEQAEALKARLEAGEDAEALAEEFGATLYNSSISQVRPGAAVNAAYADWAYDDARQPGDITLAEDDLGSVFNYCVARFEKRELDQSATATVRHILIPAETGDPDVSVPTDAQYAEAKVKAEDLLEQWKSGAATEESFAQLASENSADSGSAANGGLIANISTTSTYVDTFKDWALDPARQPGDTGLVQNTGSSVKGWHIMYYVEAGDPVWKQLSHSALMQDDYMDWESASIEGYETENGFGLKFVHN